MGRVGKKCERLKAAQGTKDDAYLHGLYSAGVWPCFLWFQLVESKPSRLIPGLEGGGCNVMK